MELPITVYHHAFWEQETLPELLRDRYGALLQRCGFDVLNFMEHHFEPEGYTAIWLLGESHLAIHTFPEDQKSYIELSSCNQKKHEAFISQLKTPNPNRISNIEYPTPNVEVNS